MLLDNARSICKIVSGGETISRHVTGLPLELPGAVRQTVSIDETLERGSGMPTDRRMDSLSAAQLADLSGVSRATVYRYFDQGLLDWERNGAGRYVFPTSNAKLVALIIRLSTTRFRFKIRDLASSVWPEFTFDELCEMADLDDGELWERLRPPPK